MFTLTTKSRGISDKNHLKQAESRTITRLHLSGHSVKAGMRNGTEHGTEYGTEHGTEHGMTELTWTQ